MKESYWGYWLIVLGIFVIVVLMLIQSVTSTNTQDYYLVKEFTVAGKMFVKASKMLPDGDSTALVFAERCKNYIKKGVAEDWDGVMNMTSK